MRMGKHTHTQTLHRGLHTHTHTHTHTLYRGGPVGAPPLYTEVERKYTEVAARGTLVYFRENLSKKMRTHVFKGTPVKTCIWGLP